jgi:hypothetical protein
MVRHVHNAPCGKQLKPAFKKLYEILHLILSAVPTADKIMEGVSRFFWKAELYLRFMKVDG